jgi:DNA-binding transcriptional LysR family regulator
MAVTATAGRARPQPGWQGIEVRHLAALAAVARERSFRGAADRLGYVQSAISGQIAHLEQAAGVRLFERASGRPAVELTEAGGLLLHHSEEILARLEAAQGALSVLSARMANIVSVAGLHHLAPAEVAKVLSGFRQLHPLARIDLSRAPVADPAGAVSRGELDVVLYRAGSTGLAPVHEFVVRDPYVLIVPAGSKLAGLNRPLGASQLASLRPIVPSAVRTDQVGARLRQLGVRHHRSVATGSVTTAQSLVSAGLGAALAPLRLVDPDDPGTATVDVSHLLPPEELALAVDPERSLPPAVEGFIGVLLQVARTHPASTAAADPQAAADVPEPRAA